MNDQALHDHERNGRGSDGKAAEPEIVCRKKPEPKQSAETLSALPLGLAPC
jgi:hypothetical protein